MFFVFVFLGGRAIGDEGHDSCGEEERGEDKEGEEWEEGGGPDERLGGESCGCGHFGIDGLVGLGLVVGWVFEVR